MVYTREQRAAAGRKGGLSRSRNLTPEERVAQAKKASVAAAEAQKMRREGADKMIAVLVEQGWTEEQIAESFGLKKRARDSRQRSNARPSAEELAPYLEAVDRDPEMDGLTWDQRQREAVLRLKIDRAAAIEKGLGE
jgi:hypothetical protein